jgi:multicomponent Na+:H+ antiporter subunit E
MSAERADAPEGGVGWVAMGLVLAVLWLAVRGVDATAVRLAEELVIGLGVGLPLAYVGRRFYRPVTGLDASLRPLPYAALYLATFVWELLTANVDVAYRVLAPSMPINPAVVEVPLRVESDLAITTIANSITLTPGTLTMDYDPDRNALYVHSIDGTDRDAVVEPIRRWEDYLLVVFDERLKPGDPVPATPAVDGVLADDEGGEAGG